MFNLLVIQPIFIIFIIFVKINNWQEFSQSHFIFSHWQWHNHHRRNCSEQWREWHPKCPRDPKWSSNSSSPTDGHALHHHCRDTSGPNFQCGWCQPDAFLYIHRRSKSSSQQCQWFCEYSSIRARWGEGDAVLPQHPAASRRRKYKWGSHVFKCSKSHHKYEDLQGVFCWLESVNFV